ncbi:MAG: hypothetical protein H6713_27625 [Myxococcales bacterium]|nr:hypothetical protein [Myxococcales bacterium]MCB9753729.1 hypothetical protein [Myxococcales bacterium]
MGLRPRPPVAAAVVASVALALASASCFDELPSPTSGELTDGGSSTSNSSVSSTTAVVETDSDSGSSSGEEATDGDTTTTTPDETTGQVSPWDGLFACLVDTPCDTWELPSCEGDVCPPLDAAGACVLQRLETRGGNERLQYRMCQGECELTGLVLRGATDDRLDRQRATLDEADLPTNYDAITRCTLVEPAFFAACLEEFTPPCADPASWMTGCTPPDNLICTPP